MLSSRAWLQHRVAELRVKVLQYGQHDHDICLLFFIRAIPAIYQVFLLSGITLLLAPAGARFAILAGLVWCKFKHSFIWYDSHGSSSIATTMRTLSSCC